MFPLVLVVLAFQSAKYLSSAIYYSSFTREEELDESTMDVFTHCSVGHTDAVLSFINEKPGLINKGDDCGRT